MYVLYSIKKISGNRCVVMTLHCMKQAIVRCVCRAERQVVCFSPVKNQGLN